jgi:hypothetical protein
MQTHQPAAIQEDVMNHPAIQMQLARLHQEELRHLRAEPGRDRPSRRTRLSRGARGGGSVSAFVARAARGVSRM